jgi:type IV pilus biogenesis protein CpaD/CtpE
MRLAALAVLAAVVAGCAPARIGPVTIQTQLPRTICEAARIGGVLVADPAYGLAFKSDGGTRGVVWPSGYSARREQDVVVLIDPSGRIVAREGDTIVSAGVMKGGNISFPCGDLQVNPSPPG